MESNSAHPLGVLASSKAALEAVHPKFVREGLMKARQKTIDAVGAIRGQVREGLNEVQATKMAMNILMDMGAAKHWHQPKVRLGAGTTLTYDDPLQADYSIQSGDAFFIDLGPVWPDPELGLEYEGDYGDTFWLGANSDAEKCAQAARTLFHEARSSWLAHRVNGQTLYGMLKNRAQELGYELVAGVDGHRLSDFPHQKYSKEGLGNLAFIPADSLWIMEIQIRHPKLKIGAFFEDLL
jgi:CDP-4-dehydro-6-deoxyglucose reductase